MQSVCLSAGHTFERQGASFGDFTEFQEAIKWVSTLHGYLTDEGIFCHQVPGLRLSEKVTYINQASPELALEIHFNSAKKDGKHIGKGSETLYFPGSPNGEKLASKVQHQLARVFSPDRGIKEGWYRMNPDNGPDYFLEKTNCPAIIIEPEFIHRKEIIQSGRDEGCAAICEGIMQFLGSKNVR